MPRDHARVQTTIWSDPHFRELPSQAQRAYLMIVSLPGLSYCGSIDYIPTRWAMMAPDLDADSVDEAVATLARNHYVLLDAATSELLVRTFVRHDGLLKMANVTKAMLKDRAALMSDDLRKAIDRELGKAYREDPKLAGWKAVKEVDPDLHSRVTGKGSPKGSAKGSRKGAA